LGFEAASLEEHKAASLEEHPGLLLVCFGLPPNYLNLKILRASLAMTKTLLDCSISSGSASRSVNGYVFLIFFGVFVIARPY
jgi:hypothetical protein